LIDKKIGERKEEREEVLKQHLKNLEKEVLMLFMDGSGPDELQRHS